ncbi:MAG: hypothetical protein QW727_00870 [Candidatus Pacearchaeota archaeon]
MKEQKEIKKESLENRTKEEDKDSYQEVGVKWLFIILAFLVTSLIIVGWILSESKKSDYIGLTFKKENFGEIPIYTTSLTGYGVNGKPIDFKLILRNNPKESKIPVIGEVDFVIGKPIYLSLNMEGELYKCGSTPLVAFGQFMDAMGFNIQTGISTEDKANEFQREYITCLNTPDATVLYLTEGNESKIERVDDKCYVLSVNNCELTEVLERFEIATLSTLTGKSL